MCYCSGWWDGGAGGAGGGGVCVCSYKQEDQTILLAAKMVLQLDLTVSSTMWCSFTAHKVIRYKFYLIIIIFSSGFYYMIDSDIWKSANTIYFVIAMQLLLFWFPVCYDYIFLFRHIFFPEDFTYVFNLLHWLSLLYSEILSNFSKIISLQIFFFSDIFFLETCIFLLQGF